MCVCFCNMYILTFYVFCLYTYLCCFVVILFCVFYVLYLFCYYIFCCFVYLFLSIELLPPGESPIAVSSSSSSSSNNNNNNNNNNCLHVLNLTSFVPWLKTLIHKDEVKKRGTVNTHGRRARRRESLQNFLRNSGEAEWSCVYVWGKAVALSSRLV
jgi:hypothetical protein